MEKGDVTGSEDEEGWEKEKNRRRMGRGLRRYREKLVIAPYNSSPC